MFVCDPIIDCQLNEGTIFIAPVNGVKGIWRIVRRDGDKIYCKGPFNKEKVFTTSQFWYLMRVKRLVDFLSVKV